MAATATSVVVSKPPPAPQTQSAVVPRPSVRPAAQFVTPPSDRSFYFGYGANMSPKVLQRRNLKPRSAQRVTLHNYKLYFNHLGGYGSVEYRPEDTSRPDVHGVLLDLSLEEMKALAGIETGYDVNTVVVTGADGTRYEAKAFQSNWSVRLFEETAPTADYIGKLREGAQVHELPTEYQAWLQDVQARDSIIPNDEENVLASPASYMAIGFSAALFLGACALFVGPPRR